MQRCRMGAIGPTGGRLRGGGPRLCVDNGMELYVLWWVLWRRAQALRENMRKSVLAPQNKNTLTAPLNQESRFPIDLVDLCSRCLTLVSFQDCQSSQPFPTQGCNTGSMMSINCLSLASTAYTHPTDSQNSPLV